jgi:TonB family protein
MIHRIKSKRFFITAILLSFVAHFMICLVIRGYKNDRCPLSFAFQCGNYGLGTTNELGSANDIDDGRIQVQFVTHSTSTSPDIDTSSSQHYSETPELTHTTPTPTLITTILTTPNNTDSQNQNQKTITHPTLANNFQNDLLNNSKNPGPGLAGGRANKSASPIRNPYPAYPSSARRSRLEGEVMVIIDVSETGRINNVAITKSSGHLILDEEVLKTIRKSWRFNPATQKGNPIPTKEELVFKFVLDQK